MAYSKEQADDFCELAVDIGIGAAQKELGYPKHYMTCRRWLDERALVVEIDTVKAKAKDWNVWYSDSDMTMTAQEIINKASEMISSEDITPQDLEKIANTVKKATELIRTIQGKDAKSDDQTDKNIEDLINKFEEKAVND